MVFRKLCFVIWFLSFFTIAALAQSSYISEGVIYKDKYVEVELQVRLNDPCTANGNGKKSKFRYNVKGTPRGFDFYVNWRMDYYNCNQSITTQTNSINIGVFDNEGLIEYIDWTFDGYQLLKPFYDVNGSYSQDNSVSFTRQIPVSVAAKSITGNVHLDYGNETTLAVNGGQLGLQAEWKWYADRCGGEYLGSGPSISVKPEHDQEYYVRAEGINGVTGCAMVTVKVNLLNKEADGITGRKLACVGEKDIPLSVKGGHLGKGGEWVWYQDSVGGKIAGRGDSIFVSPQKNTSYLVRAESPLNQTNTRQIDISVITEHLNIPGRILLPKDAVCEGGQLTMSLKESVGSPNASWNWYKDQITPSNLIGKGNSIIISPDKSTQYLVRGEGVCTTTEEQTVAVKINELSIAPTSIKLTDHNGKSIKVYLTVNGGHLSPHARWIWYKQGCGSEQPIGRGETIQVRAKKGSSYYVRAEGDCNFTTCASTYVDAHTKASYTFINFGLVSGNFKTSNYNGSVNGLMNKISDNPILSFTVGHMKKAGWYLSGKYNLKSTNAAYQYDYDQISNYNSTDKYYVINGTARENRQAITGGLTFQVIKSIYLLLGAGYGKRDLLWQVAEYNNLDNQLITDHSWAKVTSSSYSGLELEGKLMFRIGFLNIMAGMNTLSQSGASGRYYDYYGGLGVAF